MFIIEERGGNSGDEELAAVGVRAGVLKLKTDVRGSELGG